MKARRSASVTAMKCHGWRLPPLGANVPASQTLRISAMGTGSGLRRRIARVERSASNRVISSPIVATSDSCMGPHTSIACEASEAQLQNPVQRTTLGRERIDARAHLGVFYERRRVAWLATRIDQQRPARAPVFVPDRGADAVHVDFGVHARECHPEPVVQ